MCPLLKLEPRVLLSRDPFGVAGNPYVGAYGMVDTQVVDLNGDGKPDLVVNNQPLAGGFTTVAVALNNGSGGFGASTDVWTATDGDTQAWGANAPVQVRDLNGDSKPDLVLSETDRLSQGKVVVLLNNGAGGFGSPTTVYLASYTMVDTLVADVNGDGKPDLVVNDVQQGNSNAQVMVMLNNGAGGFGTAKAAWTATDGRTDVWNSNAPVQLRDLNGDSKPDLVISQCRGLQGKVYVSLNNGSGVFGSAANVFTGMYAMVDTQVADLNGDGKLDLVINDQSQYGRTTRVAVMVNNGFGQFAAPTEVWKATDGETQVWGLNAPVQLRDLNGDARPDLVITENDTVTRGKVFVALNNGSGIFATATNVYTGTLGMLNTLVADVNGDGRGDLVIDDQPVYGGAANVAVMLNSGAGVFSSFTNVWTATDGDAEAWSLNLPVQLRDLNGDSRPDLVISECNSAGQGNVFVVLNSGGGAFGDAANVYAGTYGMVDTLISDVNGDGKADLVVNDQPAEGGSAKVTVMLNDAGVGAGGFAASMPWSATDGDTAVWGLTGPVQLKDLNGDGRGDLVISESNSADVGKVFVSLNQTAVPPGNPTGLTAQVVSQSAIKVSWTLAGGESQVYLKKWTGATWVDVAILPAGTTTYTESGLAPGTRYYYDVVAVNGFGASWAATYVTAVTLAPAPPGIPTNLAAVPVTATSMKVTWTLAGGEKQVYLKKWTGSTWVDVAILPAGTTSYTETNLLPATRYYYDVVAVNAIGATWAANYVTAVTFAAAPPPAATVLTFTQLSGSSGKISWTLNGGGETAVYVAKWSGTVWQIIGVLPAGATSFTDPGLWPGARFYYEVITTNAYGQTWAASYVTGSIQ